MSSLPRRRSREALVLMGLKNDGRGGGGCDDGLSTKMEYFLSN